MFDDKLKEIFKTRDLVALSEYFVENPHLLDAAWWYDRFSPLHQAAKLGWTEAALYFCIHAPAMAQVYDINFGSATSVANQNGHNHLAEFLRPFCFPKVFRKDFLELDPD